MTIEAERPIASIDIRVVPVGGSGGGSRGPRNDTVVSAVNDGWYLHVYPSDPLCEGMRKWLGADIRVEFKDGKVSVLRLKEAEHHCHPLRKKGKSGQREHFAVPTTAIGKTEGSVKGRVVKTWTEGDEVCIDISSFFSGE
jgi:hypothetical protein